MTSAPPAVSTAFASAVLGVAPYMMANKLRSLYAIRHYGKGRVISCCVLENAVTPTSPGCVRRCTLALPGYEEKLLREQLVSVTEYGPGSAASGAEDAHRVVVELAYLPCGVDERHRAAFPDTPTAVSDPCGYGVASIRTRCTVARVSNVANRCFLSMETTITFGYTSSVKCADDVTQLARRSLEREVRAFWCAYLDAVVLALEEAVLSESYPTTGAKAAASSGTATTAVSTSDAESQQAYNNVEEQFCHWAAATGATLPRQVVLNTVEAALLSWSRLLREHRHTQVAADTAARDVAGARRIAEETARQLAERTALVEDLQAQLSSLRDTDAQQRELASATATVAALQQAIDRDRHARHLLVERHRREYSRRPTGAITSRDQTNAEAKLPSQSNGGGPFQRSMLAGVFAPDGTLCDAQARTIFSALQTSRRAAAVGATHGTTTASAGAQGSDSDATGTDDCGSAYVTANELATVAAAVDHKGLHGDADSRGMWLGSSGSAAVRNQRDLFAEKITSASEVAREGNAATSATPSRVVANMSAAAVGDRIGTADVGSPRARIIAKLAEDTVARYAFREAGRLYYDEFCLALMHIMK